MREEKEHEHRTASSTESYFDIPISWKLILQAKCTNINLPCFDLRIQITTCCSMSHAFESQKALMLQLILQHSLLPTFISSLINLPAKSICS